MASLFLFTHPSLNLSAHKWNVPAVAIIMSFGCREFDALNNEALATWSLFFLEHPSFWLKNITTNACAKKRLVKADFLARIFNYLTPKVEFFYSQNCRIFTLFKYFEGRQNIHSVWNKKNKIELLSLQKKKLIHKKVNRKI